MDILANVDYCEVDSKLPMFFRLPQNAIGLREWQATKVNIDTTEISVIPNVLVYEVGKFETKSTVRGLVKAGTTKVPVEDSSGFALGNQVRIGNLLFKLIAVEPDTHLLTLDRRTTVDIDDTAPVKLVINPEYSGVYKSEVPMLDVGRFIVTLTDVTGTVNPIENTVEVVFSLDSAVSSNGKISTIAGNTLT